MFSHHSRRPVYVNDTRDVKENTWACWFILPSKLYLGVVCNVLLKLTRGRINLKEDLDFGLNYDLRYYVYVLFACSFTDLNYTYHHLSRHLNGDKITPELWLKDVWTLVKISIRRNYSSNIISVFLDLCMWYCKQWLFMSWN